MAEMPAGDLRDRIAGMVDDGTESMPAKARAWFRCKALDEADDILAEIARTHDLVLRPAADTGAATE